MGEIDRALRVTPRRLDAELPDTGVASGSL
jgi:hypothetical protein